MTRTQLCHLISVGNAKTIRSLRSILHVSGTLNSLNEINIFDVSENATSKYFSSVPVKC